jgi:hypothetical protein
MSPRSDRDWFPAAVASLVDHVENGRILKTTEFAGVTSVMHSNALRDAGECRYDSGSLSADGRTIILLFQCGAGGREQGIALFLGWDGERVTRLDLVAKPIGDGSLH